MQGSTAGFETVAARPSLERLRSIGPIPARALKKPKPISRATRRGRVRAVAAQPIRGFKSSLSRPGTKSTFSALGIIRCFYVALLRACADRHKICKGRVQSM